jgi:peptide/nickel transport system permease protein
LTETEKPDQTPITDVSLESGIYPAAAQPGPLPGTTEIAFEAGLELKARSNWAFARRRFFRHRLAMGSLVLLVVLLILGIFSTKIAPNAYDRPNYDHIFAPPSSQFLFGTDDLGRDLFSRVLYGIKTTARVAFIVASLSTLLGTLLGAFAGYFGRWLDNLLMRFTDLVLTLPILAILLVAASRFGSGNQYRVAFILALLFWTGIARVVRGLFLSLREKEYVEAAKASGSGDMRIIFRHILPNALGPIIVNMTLVTAYAILTEASLSFLGFGIKPPTPALGQLIAAGETYMQTQWWLVVFPGIVIMLIVLCINFIGDGLRDALDPSQRRVRA